MRATWWSVGSLSTWSSFFESLDALLPDLVDHLRLVEVLGAGLVGDPCEELVERGLLGRQQLELLEGSSHCCCEVWNVE